jgi:hypothetical protein
MKVQLEVSPNATPGLYTLHILTGTDETQLTDPNDFTTLLPIQTSNGSLTISAVPEPSAFLCLGFIFGGGLVAARCYGTIRSWV